MGWWVRVIVVASTCIFGCASIAGLDDSTGAAEGTPPSNGDKNTDSTPLPSTPPSSPASSSTSSGASGTSSGGDAGTKPIDAGPEAAPPPPCTKRQIGQTCGGNNDCCSDACANTGMCTGACRGLLSTCGGDTPCCAGFVCRAFFCQLQ